LTVKTTAWTGAEENSEERHPEGDDPRTVFPELLRERERALFLRVAYHFTALQMKTLW
jgi:hypothetical protein